MGFRFRRTKKILPGVRVNLNKGSASVSFGPRGFKHTISTSGKRTTTVGIPGSGLSWTTTSGGKSSTRPSQPVQSAPKHTTQPEMLYSGPMSMAPTSTNQSEILYSGPTSMAPSTATNEYAAKPQEDVSQKDWFLTLLLAILLGFFGIHRFYVGKSASGVLYLLTCGCFFIGWIVDIVLILGNKFTDNEGNIIVKP